MCTIGVLKKLKAKLTEAQCVRSLSLQLLLHFSFSLQTMKIHLVLSHPLGNSYIDQQLD